jgi:hypothetical protein
MGFDRIVKRANGRWRRRRVSHHRNRADDLATGNVSYQPGNLPDRPTVAGFGCALRVFKIESARSRGACRLTDRGSRSRCLASRRNWLVISFTLMPHVRTRIGCRGQSCRPPLKAKTMIRRLPTIVHIRNDEKRVHEKPRGSRWPSAIGRAQSRVGLGFAPRIAYHVIFPRKCAK